MDATSLFVAIAALILLIVTAGGDVAAPTRRD